MLAVSIGLLGQIALGYFAKALPRPASALAE